MTNASPSVISSSCSIPAPRFRIGAHMVFSKKIPSTAVVAIANGDAQNQRQVPGDVDQVGHVGAERQEVAVGEVDELEDSVDEREADRAERVDRAEREAVDAALGDVVEAVVEDQDRDDVPEHRPPPAPRAASRSGP